MPVVAVRIPQLGEGLQEARLIEFLKQPGDNVKRDEFIYVMETDKATTEVESPYAGRLVEWTVQPDSVLPIGTEIGKMEVAEGTREMAAGHHPAGAPAAVSTQPTKTRPPQPQSQPPSDFSTSRIPGDTEQQVPPMSDPGTAGSGRGPIRAAGGVRIPPRTRRYLKDKQLLEMASDISAAGTKLMPEDVDRFVQEGGPEKIAAKNAAAEAARDAYEQTTLPSSQQTLNYRMARGAKVALPAVLETDVEWAEIQRIREEVRESGGPTGFAMFLWCVAQAMSEHSAFRSTLSSDGKILRTYKNVNLGVAVSLPGDRLLTAVIRKAESLSKEEFFAALHDRIQEAREGKDQVDATTTVSVSNIGASGMRTGVPVIVTPAVATLALGAVREEPTPTDDGFRFRRVASITMSFDHRLMNGVGAANFLNTIRDHAANFRWEPAEVT